MTDDRSKQKLGGCVSTKIGYLYSLNNFSFEEEAGIIDKYWIKPNKKKRLSYLFLLERKKS